MSDSDRALMGEWQARVDDLQVALDAMREERNRARDTAALLEAECAQQAARADAYYAKMLDDERRLSEIQAMFAALSADLDRLRRHYEASPEL